jgi:putative transposase
VHHTALVFHRGDTAAAERGAGRNGNGEVMRVAFALDCHDREVVGWVAATAGISGEMIRDIMVECVGRRFGTVRPPLSVQWLADNGSVYAAAKTLDIAIALNLEPCVTPVESPESNGIAEAFVKTFKRDYVGISTIPDAATALATVDDLINDYNEVHPPQTGLLLTKGIHQRSIETCRLSGLAGSTPTWTGGPTERATCIRMITAPPSTGSRLARFCSFQANACLSVMESRSR